MLLVLAPAAGAQILPSPWASADIGGPTPAGSASWASPSFTIKGGGADIWEARDEFRFVYQPVTGDADVVARIDRLSADDPWAKAGVMIRGSLAAGAAHGFALVSAGRGVAFQWRPIAGAVTSHGPGPSAACPYWVRLVRIGTRLTAFSSPDGKVWAPVGTGTVALGAVAYVGVAVTSHGAGSVATALVSQVTVRQLGVPAPWHALDIGGPVIPGTASARSGTYTVNAAGRDIWNTADQFHFVYQQVSGDVDLSLRVASLAYADPWSKTGVMIRESLSSGSRHAFALLSAGRGYAFHRRLDPGGFSEGQAGAAGPAPGWVRLVRTGSRIEAFRSADGVAWTSMGADVIPMAASVYIGIATTSHDTAATTRAVVDSLRVGVPAGAFTAPPPDSSSSTGAPTAIVFQASVDHALVTAYRLEIFAAGADPSTAAPVAASDLGKPAPDAAGDISVDRAVFFAALPAGSYIATVSAAGSGGSSRSGGVPFAR